MNTFEMHLSTVEFRLIMPAAMWDAAFSDLVTLRRVCAIGSVTRSLHGHTYDLIVNKLSFSRVLPDGDSLSVTQDWAVLHCPVSESPDFLREALKESSLRPGQMLVFVQPGLGSDLARWAGFVAHNGETYPLHAIQLVGPRMPVFRRQNTSESTGPITELVDEANDRWSRQQGAIGTPVFERFRELNVALIGAGRLGSLMGEGLIRSGLQRLTVIDPDVLELHNMNATVGTTMKDIGKPKAFSLLSYLHHIQPKSLLTGLQRPVDHHDVLERIRPADLLITCVDNDEARRHISSIAGGLVKVHLDLGSIVRLPQGNRRMFRSTTDQSDRPDHAREMAADIRLLLPGCCVDCVRAEHPIAEEPPDILEWQKGGRQGSLISINYLAAGAAIQILFDLLAGFIRGSYWQRLQWNQGDGVEAISGPVRSSGDCSICDQYR